MTAADDAAARRVDRRDPELAARIRAEGLVAVLCPAEPPDELDDAAQDAEDELDIDDEQDADADEQDADGETAADRSPRLAAARLAGKRAARRATADAGDTASWDSFWAERQREEAAERGVETTTVIRGVEVVIPHDLPLKFDQRVTQMQGSARIEDVHDLVGELFGEGVLDEWVESGMGDREFQTVLLWGIARGKGRQVTFEQAYEAVRTQGKSLLPNRSAKRGSARSGGPSKQTSAASTASPPGRSRR